MQRTGSPAQTLQISIMKQHGNAIGAQLHIHFDEAGTNSEGGNNTHQRVFGIVTRIATVSDQFIRR